MCSRRLQLEPTAVVVREPAHMYKFNNQHGLEAVFAAVLLEQLFTVEKYNAEQQDWNKRRWASFTHSQKKPTSNCWGDVKSNSPVEDIERS